MSDNRKKGCMFGLAIGDAMGAPVEFQQRSTFEPVTGYRSGGKFGLEAGDWTDDTAMALCLAQSLIECKGFDPINQMEHYLMWMQCGYLSCTGKAVGIGQITFRSLVRYKRSKKPYTDICHEKFSGNGSLMRLAPVCIYYANDLDNAVKYSAKSSATTHGSPIAIDACRYFSYILYHLIQGIDKEELFSKKFSNGVIEYFKNDPLHHTLDDILKSCCLVNKSVNNISSSGYVLHSLEASLWCFYNSDSFEEAVLKAVNLGGDADTIGAITGQLAGAYYGYDGIPEGWLNGLSKKDLIERVTLDLLMDKKHFLSHFFQSYYKNIKMRNIVKTN